MTRKKKIFSVLFALVMAFSMMTMVGASHGSEVLTQARTVSLCDRCGTWKSYEAVFVGRTSCGCCNSQCDGGQLFDLTPTCGSCGATGTTRPMVVPTGCC